MAKRVVKTKEQYQRAMREMTQSIEQKMAKLQFETVQEFYAFCLDVLAYSAEKAPLDKGDLRGTAYLEINGSMVAGGIGPSPVPNFGAWQSVDIHARVVFPLKYALVQHEHWEFHHENGQAFYLEIGLAEAAKEFAQRMAEIAFG